MLERKMASVQRILEVKPHFNADRLDIVKVLGWTCVVNKGQFKPGDLCIYFEIDSIIPKIPELMFIEKGNSDMVLRTMRLRGQLSQGLCWTTDILPSVVSLYEGTDVTSILGVGKNEEIMPNEMVGQSKGYHPTVVPRTEEVRIQTEPRLIQEFMGKLVAFTIKIDGTSTSYINDNAEKHVCNHMYSLTESENSVYWQMEKRYHILDILEKEGNISIQGEIAGLDIIKNKNPLKLNGIDFFVFKIYLNDEQRYLSPLELIAFCNKYGLKHVPMTLNILFNFTEDELLEIANKLTYESGHLAEGMVVVPMEPCYSEVLHGNLSMKVISNAYLLGAKKEKRNQ